MLKSMMRVVLLLSLVPLLGSCSPKALTQVRAQVRDWPGQVGQVRFLSASSEPASVQTADQITQQVTLSSSSIDSVGRFTLPLPSAEQLAPLLMATVRPNLSADCQSSLMASNPAARFYTLSSIAASPAGSTAPLTLVSQTRSTNPATPQHLDQRLLIYASDATRVSGEINCPATQVGANDLRQASYALNLKTGWNYAVNRQNESGNGVLTSRTESVGNEGFEGWEIAK